MGLAVPVDVLCRSQSFALCETALSTGRELRSDAFDVALSG
jgi:hypothetical protein